MSTNGTSENARKAPGIVATAGLLGLLDIVMGFYGFVHQPTGDELAIVRLIPGFGAITVAGHAGA